ncbi:MAG: hypothetical protein IPJ40_08660 [Saprospirales bacterium]|nr:hypothetical protein [Saprospirales bacterium]
MHKRSDEEIAILEVRRLIKSQVNLNEEAREFFTEKQLLFIDPYLAKFHPSEEEQEWIDRSWDDVQAQQEAEEKRQQEELERARAQAEQEKKSSGSGRRDAHEWLFSSPLLAVALAVWAISLRNQAQN